MPGIIDTAFVEILPQFNNFSSAVRSEIDRTAREVSAGLSGAITGAGQKLQQTGALLSQTGGQLTRSVTVPLVAIGTAAFKTATDFEASMAKITGLVGVPREQVQAWEDDVRSLAVEFGKSGNEAAEALFFITSAGLEGDVAMQALEQSLKASAVGLGETAVIADLATSAINAYGAEILSASDATDILTAAVREGKLQPDQLAGAMGRVLPVASAMGVSFDQVGAAFAAMSRTGTNANEAATQLRGILNGLLNPSAQARDQLEELGLSAQGLRDQIREEGLLAALETLTEAFGDNEEAQALVFGNVRALSGVMDLMGANSATTAEIFEELADSTGALDAAFAETSDTAQFQLNQVLAELKDLLLEIGQALIPIAVQALQRIRNVIQDLRAAWEGLSDSQRQLIIRFAGIAAAVGPALVALGTLLSTAGGMLVLIGKLAPLLAALTGPIGIAVAAIGLLAAAFFAADGDIQGFADNMVETITGIAETISRQLPIVLPQVVNFIVEMVDTVVQTMVTLLPVLAEGAVTLFTGLVDGLTQVLPVLLDSIITVMETVLTTIVENLPLLVQAGIDLLNAVVDGLLQALPVIIEFITGDLIPTLLSTITEMLPVILEAGITLLQALLDGMIQNQEPMLTFIAEELIPAIVDTIVALLPVILDAGMEIILALLEGMLQMLPTLVGAVITEIIPAVLGALIGAIPQLVESGARWSLGILGGLQQQLWRILDFFGSLPTRALAAAVRFVPTMLRLGGLVMDGLRRGLAQRVVAVLSWFRELPSRIRNSFPNPYSILVNIGATIMSGLLSGLQSKWESVKSFVSSIGSAIQNLKGPLDVDRKLLTVQGQAIMQSLQDGMRDEMDNLTDLLRGITGTISMEVQPPRDGRPTFQMGPPTSQAGPDRAPGSLSIREAQDQAARAERIVIEIRSDGTRRGDLLVEELSDAIRIRGGNVQRVLGTGRGD